MVLAATATFNLNNLQRRATPSSAASSNQGVIPMTDTRTQLIPGPDHPITVERWPGHVTVRRGTVVIAETDRAFELRESTYPAVYYVPLDDVHRDFLRRSEVHTWCPYKGEASYFDLIATKDTDEMPASGTTPTPSQPSATSRTMWPSTPTGSPSAQCRPTEPAIEV
jgi:uncharacterized protein (DUF427 family)